MLVSYRLHIMFLVFIPLDFLIKTLVSVSKCNDSSLILKITAQISPYKLIGIIICLCTYR